MAIWVVDPLVQVGGAVSAVSLLILSWRGSCPLPPPPLRSCILAERVGYGYKYVGIEALADPRGGAFRAMALPKGIKWPVCPTQND